MTKLNTQAVEFDKYPSTPSFKDTMVGVKKLFGKREFLGLEEDGKTPIFSPAVLPTVEIEGTVKLHGTHGDVWLDGDMLVIQSRNRIITPEDDNQGFARFVMENEAEFRVMLIGLAEQGLKPYISGEWAGGNIQGGIALTGMEKSFFIFNPGVHPTSSAKNIYNIQDFDNYLLTLDFNNPEPTLAIIDEIVADIDKRCPVGCELNPDRTSDIGEGIVWQFTHEGRRFMFKSKGTSHQRTGKIAKPRVELPEGHREITQKFLDEAVTVDRLEQGIEYLKEMGLPLTMKSMGVYLKWVCEDTYKENQVAIEEAESQGVMWKKGLNSGVTQLAKAYFEQKI